jgi:hypothetical protein
LHFFRLFYLNQIFFSDFQLFGLSTIDETSLVEMRIWCIKIGIVLVLHNKVNLHGLWSLTNQLSRGHYISTCHILTTESFSSNANIFFWQLYDKRDDLKFIIVNFPHIYSNIPLSPAYGVYISQLLRYARDCSRYDQFLSRGRLLTDKLMLQGILQSRLMPAFRKLYGHYNDLIYNYKLSLSHMLSVIFHNNS